MKDEAIRRFESAARCTGVRIRRALMSLPDSIKINAQEIRLRCGRPVMVSGLYGDVFVSESGRESYILSSSALITSINDVEDCFRIICGYSVHTHQNSICSGYVTVQGGHRAGIVGTAVYNKGEVSAVRDVSSINIRIAREFKGIADDLFEQIKSSSCGSVIVAGPPASGKTTVLRDLARLLSGERGGYMKTVVIDEREEIAACFDGVPQNDIGISSDVLSGYSKGPAVMIALRSMAPQNIILDEIGTDEEALAIEAGLNSGVNFYLSVHASSREELLHRKQIARLLKTGAFGAVAFLEGKERPSQLSDFILAGELIDKTCGCANDCRGDDCRRVLCSLNGE